MRIFRSIEAPVSPVDPATFLGQATVQRLAHDETGVAVGVYRVTFSDGGRTNWHKHSGPQWLVRRRGPDSRSSGGRSH